MGGRIHFQPVTAPWVLLLAAAVLALGAYFYYRRRGGEPHAFARTAAAVLRLVGFALLIFALSGPYAEVEYTLRRARRLAVLVDNSLSMSTADSGEGGATRFEAARQALAAALPSLAQYDRKVYEFSRKASLIGAPSSAGALSAPSSPP